MQNIVKGNRKPWLNAKPLNLSESEEEASTLERWLFPDMPISLNGEGWRYFGTVVNGKREGFGSVTEENGDI